MLRQIKGLFLAGALLVLAGCAGQAPHYRVHESLLATEQAQLPTRVVMLPVDIEVSEISAGGVVEEVKAWSDQATANVESALRDYVNGHDHLHLIPTPALSDAEAAQVEQHLALYDVVGGTAFSITSNTLPAWEHKRKQFDYGVGPGLAFLRDKTGADAALIVIGMDQISSAERKALAVGAAVLGVGVPLGQSFLSVGVIDLNTGDLLWLNYAFSYANLDLRKPEDAGEMIDKMFADYPGLEAYRNYAAN